MCQAWCHNRSAKAVFVCAAKKVGLLHDVVQAQLSAVDHPMDLAESVVEPIGVTDHAHQARLLLSLSHTLRLGQSQPHGQLQEHVFAHLQSQFRLGGVQVVGRGQHYRLHAWLLDALFQIHRVVGNPPLSSELHRIRFNAAGHGHDFDILLFYQSLHVCLALCSLSRYADFHRPHLLRYHPVPLPGYPLPSSDDLSRSRFGGWP